MQQDRDKKNMEPPYDARELERAALDALQVAVFGIDAEGMLQFANEMGEAALQEKDPFSLRAGRLWSPDPHVNERLRSRRSSAFTAKGKDAPWLVRILPLGASVAAALVYANSAAFAHPLEVLQSMFHFTDAEAGIAQLLASGRTAKDIAHQRGVTIHTVRTQLRQILQKAGVRRQADLASLLLNIPRVR
jgi:DNA-binding CsgD family transcriptional regulator